MTESDREFILQEIFLLMNYLLIFHGLGNILSQILQGNPLRLWKEKRSSCVANYIIFMDKLLCIIQINKDLNEEALLMLFKINMH